MSGRVHLAPFALASDGDVLLNVAMFDTPKELTNLLRLAQTQSVKVFVGVALSGSELDFILSELRHAYRDGAAWLVGGRQRRASVRSKKKKLKGAAAYFFSATLISLRSFRTVPLERCRVRSMSRCRSSWSGNVTTSRRATSSRSAIFSKVSTVGRASPFSTSLRKPLEPTSLS